MKQVGVVLLAGALLWPTTVQAQVAHFEVSVSAGKEDYHNVPVSVPLSLPKELVEVRTTVGNTGDGKGHVLGQLTKPGLLTEQVKPSGEGQVRRDLHFVLPSLKAGTTVTYSFNIKPGDGARTEGGFSWNDHKGEFAELSLVKTDHAAGKPTATPVMRYMYKAYDNSKENRDLTYKVFHHLYDPAGKRFVTNGGHTDYPGEPRKMDFPHHRGLMFAFMRNTYGNGKTADTWHARPGDSHESHEGFLDVEQGPVLGRHRVAVDWHGPQNEVFAKEERELTVYNVPGGTLVEFASRLKTAGGKVKLDGDPQHAGFQFRAAQDVADKTKGQTYYLRPDGKGQPGATRNWPGDKGHVDLPWDALSFVLDGQRYTVAYLNHPHNPKESRFSERDYGRFGCYFEYEVTEDHPLLVDYRVWLQQGEMTGPEVQALSAAFVTPPTVTVK